MRVVINAQLDPATSGGIAQALLGLASGLSRLHDADDYRFICSPTSAAWLEPYLGPHRQMIVNEHRTPPPRRGVRPSDGFFESFEPDVLHFPYQSYTRTEVPTVFTPHDLQHVHLPDLFEADELARRQTLYEQACRSAAAVATASHAVKGDVVTHYAVDPGRVHVIPWGPPTRLYDETTQGDVLTTLERWQLKPGFALYPAQTWPHKNHLRLLQALIHAADRSGTRIPLVCTGAHTEYYAVLAEFITEHGLSDQARFLGRVSESDLVALYRSARCLILPSLCEASSLPILEAFCVDLPVACSNLPALTEQFGSAALTFDPDSIDDIAHGLSTLYEDANVRCGLIAQGRKCLTHFSWTRTAQDYRDLYRTVARQTVAASFDAERP
jgi:glycosyltransferase involved in cell wall biosynthesis